ncbi:MAG: hypothetical protein OEV66_02545 [Spirochaetia bacterium]|nr:hypothetical protein [Spirochaetia bacterium]
MKKESILYKVMTSWKLWILPGMLIMVGWITLIQMIPIGDGGGGYDEDPAYVYLTSGLYLLKGHIPIHNDHPGTPVQVLGAVVIFLRWGISRITGIVEGDVATEVFRSPELYMGTISVALLLMNVGALLYLGRRVFQVTKNYPLALLVQTSVFIFENLVPGTIYLAPESLLIFASLCLLGVLADEIFVPFQDNTLRNKQTAVLAGVICGFGLAVKITFLPLVGLLLLLNSYHRILHAIRYMLLSSFICILPILPHFFSFLQFIFRITKHTGVYGSGNEGIVDLGLVPTNFFILIREFPLLYIVVCALLVALVLMWRRERSVKSDRLAGLIVPVILILVMLGQTLMVLKHFSIRYMVPVLPVSLVGLAWLIRIIWVNPKKWMIARWLPTAMLAACFVLGVMATYHLQKTLHSNRVLSKQEQALFSNEINKHKDPFIIGTYRSLLPKGAIYFGLTYTRGELNEAAKPFLENFDGYNMWTKSLFLSSPEQINKIIASGRDVLMVVPDFFPQPDAFILESLVHVSNRTLFRVIRMRHSGQ